VIAGLLVLTVTALTAAGIAVRNAATAARNAANAERQHAIALSRQLAAESLNIDGTHPVTARRLAVAAWAVFPTSQAASAITTLLVGHQQEGMLPADPSTVFAVTFSRDGKLLASGGPDGNVRLWQVSLFTHPYAVLCADAGPPTLQEWNHYASGEPRPKVCG
jgi:hypothetical protein